MFIRGMSILICILKRSHETYTKTYRYVIFDCVPINIVMLKRLHCIITYFCTSIIRPCMYNCNKLLHFNLIQMHLIVICFFLRPIKTFHPTKKRKNIVLPHLFCHPSPTIRWPNFFIKIYERKALVAAFNVNYLHLSHLFERYYVKKFFICSYEN